MKRKEVMGEQEPQNQRTPEELFEDLFRKYNNFLFSLEKEEYWMVSQTGGMEEYESLWCDRPDKINKAKEFTQNLREIMRSPDINLAGLDITRLRKMYRQTDPYTEEENNFAAETYNKVEKAFLRMVEKGYHEDSLIA